MDKLIWKKYGAKFSSMVLIKVRELLINIKLTTIQVKHFVNINVFIFCIASEKSGSHRDFQESR